ncbi:MAG: stage 0 sporulation family protein [Candidatus Omnitrophota bacterium]
MRSAVVRLRETGNVGTYVVPEDVGVNDCVIIEADRGLDYGEVLEIHDNVENVSPRGILRKVTEEDLKTIEENKSKAKEAIDLCCQKIEEHKLSMKLVEAEYSFDRKKISFYFTSDERIDFRELVKDLAKIFKIRIEMRQIGVRDETRLFGGIGPCGKGLCCSTFLKNFEPVSIKMAKQQKLPLNPSKISGICGRLMCCLFYEHKHYHEMLKQLPKEGENIDTKNGPAKVVAVNVLKGLVTLEFDDGHIDKVVFGEEENR